MAVGLLMMQAVVRIDFDDLTETVPALTTIVLTAFSYNIANGMTAGLILYPLFKAAAGRWREISLGAVLLAGCASYGYPSAPVSYGAAPRPGLPPPPGPNLYTTAPRASLHSELFACGRYGSNIGPIGARGESLARWTSSWRYRSSARALPASVRSCRARPARSNSHSSQRAA